VTSYISFQIYLIGSLFSLIAAARAILRRDHDQFGAMAVLFLCCGIGLSCNLPGFLREFAGMYGIVLSG
jgi:hypothetical protein